jgi:2,3-bisphosphoglycerate-dependent phosphoglycerate mutase
VVKAHKGGRLLLVRHAQTSWNLADRRLGRADIPLDSDGQEQAQLLSQQLEGEFVDAIFSSPLVRARDTAAPTAHSRGLVVQIDPDLVEFDYGSFSGLTRREAKLKLGRDYLHTPVLGGESLADAWVRACRFAARVKPALSAGSRFLVVGHQRINRLLVGAFEGRTLDEAAAAKDYKPSNGSVLELQVGPDQRVASRRVLERPASDTRHRQVSHPTFRRGPA